MEHVYNLTMKEAVEKYNKHFGEKLTVLHKKEVEMLADKEYGTVSSSTLLPGTGFQVWMNIHGVEHTVGVLHVNFAKEETPAA